MKFVRQSLFYGAVWIVTPCLLFAQAKKSYHYTVTDNFGDTRFAGEIQGTPGAAGKRYDVEFDSLGRMSRYAHIRNGIRVSQVIYQYAEGSSRPSSFENIAVTGEILGGGRISRNAPGARVRIDRITTTGQVTGYVLRIPDSDSTVETSYSADGKITGQGTTWFSSSGTAIRIRTYPNDSTTYESDIDGVTGLTTETRKYQSAALVVTSKYTYETDGSLSRTDVYDQNRKWYGDTQYTDGLEVLKRYKWPDGISEEHRNAYDEKRLSVSSGFYRDGTLICTFKFERHPNGAIKRTLALAQDGSLMAEYPNLYVALVERNGEALDQPGVAIIHKAGNWW